MQEIRVPWEGWEVVEKLGNGSFGAVCHIRRQLLGAVEDAAMKTITIPREQNEAQTLLDSGYEIDSINRRYLDDLQDIAKEYNLMAKLKGNANIVYCDDLYYEANPNGVGYTLYIRMELLTPMLQKIADPVNEQQVVKVGMDLCNALTACRAQNIIHRDIKPANILVSVDGTYKLGDFGVAKTTERTAGGTKTGTYNFMAPEVYNNQPYGLSVDIYSLGMVLYWMLNRRVGPFLPLPPELPRASQLDEAKQRRFSGEPLPPPATGSEALRRIVLKACAFDPAQRYRTPEELYADLMALNGASFRESSTWQQTVGRGQNTVPQDNTESTIGNAWGVEDEETQGSVGTAGWNAAGTVGGTAKRSKTDAVGVYDIRQQLTIDQELLDHGTVREVELEDGRTVEVRIPAGSKAGSILRLKGQGKAEPGTGARGDLCLELTLEEDLWDEEIPEVHITIPRSLADSGGAAAFLYHGSSYGCVVPAGIRDGGSFLTTIEPEKNRKRDVMVVVHSTGSKGYNALFWLFSVFGWLAVFGMDIALMVFPTEKKNGSLDPEILGGAVVCAAAAILLFVLARWAKKKYAGVQTFYSAFQKANIAVMVFDILFIGGSIFATIQTNGFEIIYELISIIVVFGIAVIRSWLLSRWADNK